MATPSASAKEPEMISAIDAAAPSTIGCWGNGRLTAVKVGPPNVLASALGRSRMPAATVPAGAAPPPARLFARAPPPTLPGWPLPPRGPPGRGVGQGNPNTTVHGA